LKLLAPLLRVKHDLDPQFMAPYEYGAVILPEVNQDEAISLLNYGIAANPSSWRLYHYLGYIYWQQEDYAQASDIYAGRRKVAGRARMDGRAQRAYESGRRLRAKRRAKCIAIFTKPRTMKAVKEMVTKQIMRLDSLDERT